MTEQAINRIICRVVGHDFSIKGMLGDRVWCKRCATKKMLTEGAGD
tara:strand:+ start:170 stop:307 length:138 start_codon:yes stop_codon:yes gene_type:complete